MRVFPPCTTVEDVVKSRIQSAELVSGGSSKPVASVEAGGILNIYGEATLVLFLSAGCVHFLLQAIDRHSAGTVRNKSVFPQNRPPRRGVGRAQLWMVMGRSKAGNKHERDRISQTFEQHARWDANSIFG